MLRSVVLAIALTCLFAQVALAYPKSSLKAAEDAVSNGHADVAIQLATDRLNHSREPNDKARLLAVRASALIEEDRRNEAEKGLQTAFLNASDKDTRGYVMDTAARAYLARAEYFADYMSFNQQKLKFAISNYTAALNYDIANAVIYHDRGYAYLLNLDFDEAIRDLNHAIELNDASAKNYEDRGMADEVTLDFTNAIRDYGEAIDRYPANNVTLFDRGRAYAILGNYPGAERDLKRAESIDSADGPTLLWLHIVHMHTQRDDLAWLRKRAQSIDLKRWPGPVIGYFVGKKTAAEMIDTALHSTGTNEGYQRCDGWFYLAEDELQKGDARGARKLFQSTVDSCNPIDFEWPAAKMELRRLQ